jgi:hypothetical protein
MATNKEMILEMSLLMGYEYNGENLKTFNEWAKEGYVVKKGEKSFMSLELWKPFNKKVEDKETGEEKDEKRFMLKLSHLFTPDQVEKGEIKKRAPKKKTAAKKKKTKNTFVKVGA